MGTRWGDLLFGNSWSCSVGSTLVLDELLPEDCGDGFAWTDVFSGCEGEICIWDDCCCLLSSKNYIEYMWIYMNIL